MTGNKLLVSFNQNDQEGCVLIYTKGNEATIHQPYQVGWICDSNRPKEMS